MRSQRVNTTEQLWLAFTFFRGWRQGCGNWMKVVKSSNLPITWFWFPWQPDPISSHHDKGHSYGSLHLEICKSFRSSVPEPGQRTNLYFLEITIITEGNNKTYVIMIWLHFTMISALEVIFTSTYTVWWKHYVDNLKSILVRVFTTWKLVNTINWSLFLCWLSRFRKSWLRKC